MGRDHAAPTAIAGNDDVNFEFMPRTGLARRLRGSPRSHRHGVQRTMVHVQGVGFFPSSPGRMDDSDRIHLGLKHSNVPLNPYDTVAGVLRHARRRTPSARAAQILRDLT